MPIPVLYDPISFLLKTTIISLEAPLEFRIINSAAPKSAGLKFNCSVFPSFHVAAPVLICNYLLDTYSSSRMEYW